ncbi:protein kinase domain-containing protein [Streptomyces thermoalcalitolerans]
MELVPGRSLEQIVVEGGPLGLPETARIGLGLVAALRQVHARGVLHRDIKPGNVLVGHGGGRVVLTDFGIAAIQDAKALTRAGMLVGSPDYMAPERISGRPQGPPSDLWSLGATLCAALGGRSPFSRDTTFATLHAVLYEEPLLPASAGPLTEILTALLKKEPADRPDLDALEAALRPLAFPLRTPTVPVSPAAERTRLAPPPPEPVPPDTVPAPTRPDRERPPPEQPTHDLGQRPDAVRPEAPARSAADQPVVHGVTEPRSAPTVPPGRTEEPEAGNGREGRRGRAGLAAAVGVVVAGVVAGDALALLDGGEADRDTAGDGARPHASTPTSSPAPSRASSPASPLTSPSASFPASAPASSTPPPTVEGTSRPPSLPPGAHREAGGFAWAPPKGWRRDVQTGAEVHYTSPDGTQELVAKSSLAQGDLMESWRTSERNARRGQDYRKIRLERATFRGHPAVVWEYTFTFRGAPWHARLLGFDADGRSYQISTWYRSDTEHRALPTYERVRDSFTVL